MTKLINVVCSTWNMKISSINPLGVYQQTSFVPNQDGFPFRVAVARQLTTIEQRTILENRKRTQLLQDNDDWKEKKTNYMAAIKEEKKRPIKSTFRVFRWVIPNQRRTGQESWTMLPEFRLTHNQRRTSQITWARLPGFGITPNRLT